MLKEINNASNTSNVYNGYSSS